MTNQEVFDIVSAHLLKQNAKSIEDGVCKYKGPNGMMCAVGVLIPDDKYDPIFEGKSVDRIQHKLGFEHNSLALLRDLQFIHDYVEVDEWSFNLEICRRRYNLK